MNCLDDDFHSGLPRASQKLGCSIPRLLESQEPGTWSVTVNADGHAGAEADQAFQNGKMLPGKIGKPFYVKDMILCEASLLQSFQQPDHLIPWVPFSPGTEGIIPAHQQR